MKQTEKPLPCPFCGSHETDCTFTANDLHGAIKSFCFCWNCKTRGPQAATPEEAIAKWNMEEQLLWAD